MSFSILGAVAAGFAVSQIATFATTIYLHRCQTHRAFELHPSMHWLFRFLLWITTGQRTREWVAVHRKHHAYSDKPGDPHSPVLEGFAKVQFLNWLLYAREARNQETVRKYARDIRENLWDTILFNHGLLGLASGITLLCLLLGVKLGLLAAAVHVVCYVGILTACVNAIGHHRVVLGYQNYSQSAAETYNYKWLAWITGGEGLHNNHHADPASAKLSHFAGEPDPGWAVEAVLKKLKLAWAFKMPRVQNTARPF